MKKFLALLLVMVMCVAAGIGGTVAYLTDTEEAVNVMTVGNVSIEQHEYQRAEGVAHDAGDPGAGNGVKEGALVPYVNGQGLYPAYPVNGEVTDYTAEMDTANLFFWGDYVYSGTAGNGLWNDNKLKGVMDKFVFVENTGNTDAYFRTVIAFECPEDVTIGEPAHGAEIMINTNIGLYDWEDIGYITVDNVRYAVMVATYHNALKPGNQAHPSLLQVVMTHNAKNEHMELIGNTYEILVLSQAVQTANITDGNDDPNDDAKFALDTAFGEVTETNATAWFEGMEMPDIFAWDGVNYVTDGEKASISAISGDTIYRGVFSDGKSNVKEVVVGEGITRLNNRAFCKAPTITNVTLPASLTYIDESVFQQSGITKIEVPKNVTYIGKQAFGACDNLETIVIKAENVTIANYVARACANLKEVYIYSDSVTFESGSMYFTNQESGDASGITFYVKDQKVADSLYTAFSTSNSYGLLIKSIDGATTYYNTLK